MATGTWEQRNNRWVMRAPSTHDEVAEPLRLSDFLLHFDDKSSLCALRSREGDKLDADDTWQFRRAGEDFDKSRELGRYLGSASEADLTCDIIFKYTPSSTELRLSGALATLLQKLEGFKDKTWASAGEDPSAAPSQIALPVNGEPVLFSREGSGWKASVPARIEPPVPMTLMPENIRVDVKWFWHGEFTHYFTIGANDQVTELQRGKIPSRLSRQRMGLVFAHEPIGTLQLHNDWKVRLLRELHYEIRTALDEPVTLQQYVEMARRSPMHGHDALRKVHVRQLKGPENWEWPSPLFAVRNDNQLVASFADGSIAWGFGPRHPRFVGIESKEALRVYTVSTGRLKAGLRLRGVARPSIAQNRLPTSVSEEVEPSVLHLVCGDDGSYGPLIAATSLPAGSWKPFDPASTGERLISFRGFVDHAELLDMPEGRRWLRLKTGFSLKAEWWSAAPFAGLAMYPDGRHPSHCAGFWGALHDCEESYVLHHEDGQWSVVGQWLKIDPVKKIVEEMAAFAPDAVGEPMYLVLFNQETSVAKASGAVLRLDPGKNAAGPVLCGWLSDTQGSVEGLDTSVKLVGGASHFRLGKGQDIDPNIPDHFKVAFHAALQDKRKGEDEIHGVRWKRHPNQDIEVWIDPGKSGVFEQVPVKVS